MIELDSSLSLLKKYTGKLLKKDFYKNRTFDCCPYCHNKRYIKYGFYEGGIQRYQCKNPKCHRTFSKTTNSVFSHSQKGIGIWMEYIELMLENQTLRYCAAELNIGLTTAFYWRHKLLNSIKSEVMPERLKGDVFISTAILHQSFKHEIVNSWHKGHRLQIMAVSGADDSILSFPIDYKSPIYKEFNERVYPLVDKKSYIKSYDGNIFSGISKNHNKNLFCRKKISSEDYEKSIDNECIKHFEMNLRMWIRRFCGVKKKYLINYLSYFILFNLERHINYFNIVYSFVNSLNFISIDDIKHGEFQYN